MICIGDWRRNSSDSSKVFRYDSGHHNNVFQAKPMPHSGDRLYVTCAADGQVSIPIRGPHSAFRSIMFGS